MKTNFFYNCLKISLLTFLIGAMFFSCARVGSIGGGEKDTSAPVMVRSKPKIYSGDFDGKKAKVKFDEFFTLDNIESKFLISPPHVDKKPKIKVKGKKVIVKFKEPLKPDTTYTLQFFDAIKDYNEGNILPGYEFVFSTGSVTDTFAIAGHVYDAKTLEKEKDMLVGIYGEKDGVMPDDSAFIKYKPDFITRTDTAGAFKINNIRPGKYRIFALADINETQKFDLENEKIAFMEAVIEPKAENMHKEDSLRAGTILHLGTYGHPILDTLKTDSVIVQDILYTTPNNLKLYAFNEIKLVQYITERSRDMRIRFNLYFNKPVETSDSVIITYVDDTLKSPQMFFNYNHTRDSLVVWLTDTTDIYNDTLQLRVSFPTLDSLQNPIVETDTLPLKFVVKKASKNKKQQQKPVDTGIDSLQFRLKTSLSKDFDLNSNVTVEIPVPLYNVDTSRIKLYECVDSSFVEDLNQKLLKAVRLDSGFYRLVFKRPVVGDINFYPTDTVVNSSWYNAIYSQGRDTIDIMVTDSAMWHKPAFKNMIKHVNEFYCGQTQKLRDSVSTTIVPQKILEYSRPSRDSIIVKFEKHPKQGVEVSAINITPIGEWFTQQIDNDRMILLLTDTTAIYKDTLAIKINSYDRQVYNKVKMKYVNINYRDTLFSIYKPPFQKLKSYTRVSDDTLRLCFERSLIQKPRVTHAEGWQMQMSDSLSQKSDTIFLFLSRVDAAVDTLNLAIEYDNIDRLGNKLLQHDTLKFIKPKAVEEPKNDKNNRRRKSDVGMDTQKKNADAKKNMITAKLLYPVEYQIMPDTMNSRNFKIVYPWEEGKEYRLVIDDTACVSIYNTPSLYYTQDTKIRTKENYGTFKVKLLNVGNVEHYPDIDEDIEPFKQPDTARIRRRKAPVAVDTMPGDYNALTNGQLLICLTNDKGEIKYQKEITQDGDLLFDFILPGEYRVMAIYDVNSNKVWDTGDYLKHLYPERVIILPDKQTIKADWVTESTWKL